MKQPNKKLLPAWFIIFLAFFALFFITGYIHGRMDRHNERVLFHEILKECCIVNQSKWYFLKGEQPVYEILIPGSAPRFTIHVADNKVFQSVRDQSIFGSAYKQVFWDRTGELFLGFIGGGALYTIKDAGEFVTKSKRGIAGRIQQVAGAVAGSVSGYAFGYWAATHTVFDISRSPAVAEFLTNPENRLKLKRQLWLAMHKKCALPAYLLKNKSSAVDALYPSLAMSIEAAEERVADLNWDVGAVDFRALDELFACIPTPFSEADRFREGRQSDYDYWILQAFIRATPEQKKTCVETFKRVSKKFGGDVDDETWSDLFRKGNPQERSSPEHLVKRLQELDQMEFK